MTRNKQAGWVALVVYGLLALGAAAVAYAMWDGVQHWCNTACEDLTVERDRATAATKLANDQLEQANQANASCRASITKLEGTVAQQNAQVDEIGKLGADMMKRAQAALRAAASAESNAATARLTAIATGPPTRGDFHAQCTMGDGILSDLAREQRLRDARTATKAVN